jgi:uncharacterized membrane protein
VIDKFEDWANKSDANKAKAFCLILVAPAMIGVAMWIIGASMEAAAFNRVTSSEVTTWDAMWLQLRVDRPTSD